MVGRAGARRSVAVTGMRPARLQNIDGLAGADAIQNVDLVLDETASLVSSHGSVEEGVQVGTNNVHDAAEGRRAAGVFPDGQRLSGGDQASVPSTLESTRAA